MVFFQNYIKTVLLLKCQEFVTVVLMNNSELMCVQINTVFGAVHVCVMLPVSG